MIAIASVSLSARSQQRDDLAGICMPPGLLLRKDERAIAFHFEYAAAPFEEIDLRLGESRADLGRQTGGPWFVVSDDAVFDRDVHGVNDSRA